MVELYPHQVQAVEWMQATERRPRMVPDQPHGGILAHAMGLGKTLTMLSFIRAQEAGRTLVVCPKSLLVQWEAEAHRVGWETVTTYHGITRKLPPSDGTHQLVLTTFDIVRLEQTRGRRMHATTWDRVVLDEAHRICEQSSKTSKAIQALRAPNRWCITGTPFKNGMSDLMALSRFLMVAPYCNISWWRWYGNSVSKLREWRRLFLHLRDKSVLTLPPMTQHVVEVVLSPVERALDTRLGEAQWKVHVGDELLTTANHDQHELLRILRQRQAANHPMLLTPLEAMRHLVYARPTPPRACEACGGGQGTPTTGCAHRLCPRCGDEPVCAVCIATTLRTQNPQGWLHSAKTRALWTYLRDTARVKHTSVKVVIFSQWTTCLDLLGWMLDTEGVGHARYDGRVNTTEEREQVITHFQTTPKCQVMLTSLGAGGEGVNLTFASHVIIMEPYWNLAVEQQAIDRLHRIGQEGTTHVVRLQVKNSVEEWVQSIQVRKTNELQRLLFEKVVDASPNLKPGGLCGAKRSLTQGLRSQFEPTHDGKLKEGEGCLGAFLMRPSKVVRVK
jgi:SNF2 family DNA or RNA helicase